MRIVIAVVSAVFVLAMINNIRAIPRVICRPNDVLTVEVDLDDYPELEDFYVTVVSSNTDCNSSNAVQLRDVTGSTNLQEADLTCHNFTIGDSFVLTLVRNKTIQIKRDDIATYNLTCDTPENITESFNFSVTARPSLATLFAFYVSNVTTTIDKTIVAVQERVTIKVKLDAASADDVVITIIDVKYQVVGTDFSIDLVSDRCPNNTYVSSQALTGTPNNAPATEIDFAFDAFILNIDFTKTSVLVNIELLIGFCFKEDTAFCFSPGACSGSDKLGRRKREAAGDDIQTNKVTEQLMIFPSKQLQKEYVYERMEELGIPLYPKQEGGNEGQICVNKTVTAVLLSLLLIAMALCFISSVIMFLKLKKKRSDKLIKSEHSYSNKGF